MAKQVLINPDCTKEEKDEALRFILDAMNQGSGDAMYVVAYLVERGFLAYKDTSKSTEEQTMKLLRDAAWHRSIQARARLNFLCRLRYWRSFPSPEGVPEGPLRDFDGKPIRLKKVGAFTPVDAELSYQDGKNVLTLSTSLTFVPFAECVDEEKYREAVRAGILDWSGEYKVFGGQPLRVEVRLEEEDRFFDTVYIMSSGQELEHYAVKLSGIAGGEKGERIKDIFRSKRSFASSGLRWKATSRKMIVMQSEDGMFDDYEELRAVAKHEFGHILGLGDLYESRSDAYPGVEKGSYPELDCYHVTDRFYNLVMCDHSGPVSNNDIEMVIMAFLKNKMQHFQKIRKNDRISEALGKGN